MSTIDSVSSVSSSASSAAKNTQKNKAAELSASTKSKLAELGIDSSNVTSEAQAQILISQKEMEKSQEAAQTEQTQETSESSSTDETLMSEAKSLASSLGVTVSSDDELEDIISNCQAKITEMMADPMNRMMAMAYQQQLDAISDESGSNQTASAYSAMSQIAANNKYQFNL